MTLRLPRDSERRETEDSQTPLFVDLDGTLIKSDLLIESFLAFVRRAPTTWLSAIAWLRRGKDILVFLASRKTGALRPPVFIGASPGT
jgi:hypothetical protein